MKRQHTKQLKTTILDNPYTHGIFWLMVATAVLFASLVFLFSLPMMTLAPALLILSVTIYISVGILIGFYECIRNWPKYRHARLFVRELGRIHNGYIKQLIVESDILICNHRSTNNQNLKKPHFLKNMKYLDQGDSIYAFCLQEKKYEMFQSLFNNKNAENHDIETLMIRYDRYHLIYERDHNEIYEIPFNHVLKQLAIGADIKSQTLKDYINDIVIDDDLETKKPYQILANYQKHRAKDATYYWLANEINNVQTPFQLKPYLKVASQLFLKQK